LWPAALRRRAQPGDAVAREDPAGQQAARAGGGGAWPRGRRMVERGDELEDGFV
jgi:hypothetical protein